MDAGHVRLELAEHVLHGRGGARRGRSRPHCPLEQAGRAHQGSTGGWRWASVHVIAFRKGKAADAAPSGHLDHITAAPLTTGRRAELPPEVAAWMIEPFAVPGGTMCDTFAGSGALVKAG
jgi:hypothetical protein